MAEPPPLIQFEDIPLEQARMMSRAPRMDPELYHALQKKIQSLGDTATRIRLPDGTRPRTMKHRILHLAAALGVLVTIRRVSGGLVFWRSTDEDIRQAHEVGARRQTPQQRQHARPGRHRTSPHPKAGHGTPRPQVSRQRTRNRT